MKKIFFTLLLLPLTSFALVEGRITYGGLVTQNAAKDACGALCSQEPPLLPLVGLGADVLISPPLTSYGIGLRYEKLSLSGSSGSIEAAAQIERVAVLLNYRMIDTIIHLGPIASFGISNQTSLKVTESSTPKVNYSSSTSDSASLGFEIGVKPLIVIPLAVGAEAGYQYLKVKNAKDSVNNTESNLDFSGAYLKLFLGLSF